MPPAVLLDVDTGVDDAVALVCACAAAAAGEIDLVGVSCVAGNVPLANVVRNTRHVLGLTGAGDVPVSVGASQPLTGRGVVTAPHVHGEDGLGYAAIPAPAESGSASWAPSAIVGTARRHAGELVVVATGPLTNLALALHEEPRLPELVRSLVIMGGAFRAPGNVTATAEFNVHADPEAWQLVLDAFAARGVVPAAVGLDVSTKVLLDAPTLMALAHQAGHRITASAGEPWTLPGGAPPLLALLCDAVRFTLEFSRVRNGTYAMALHDPLALAAAVVPGIVEFERVRAAVDCGPGLGRGQTVVDWRGVHLGGPPHLDVSVAVDAPAAVERIGAWLSAAVRV